MYKQCSLDEKGIKAFFEWMVTRTPDSPDCPMNSYKTVPPSYMELNYGLLSPAAGCSGSNSM